MLHSLISLLILLPMVFYLFLFFCFFIFVFNYIHFLLSIFKYNQEDVISSFIGLFKDPDFDSSNFSTSTISTSTFFPKFLKKFFKFIYLLWGRGKGQRGRKDPQQAPHCQHRA